ncbi:unnamed protein product [Ceratitis capitata]|uniref:(Mediterranean fruit fly) hypothetical protein n=1 Tax=Ceratitis capitata TaxID=7213 RepID=A0A811UJ10_CERCA|nr:unnamed protein product [Ceratitis capitata]
MDLVRVEAERCRKEIFTTTPLERHERKEEEECIYQDNFKKKKYCVCPEKKSDGVESDEHGGQSKSPLFDTKRTGNNGFLKPEVFHSNFTNSLHRQIGNVIGYVSPLNGSCCRWVTHDELVAYQWHILT